VPSSVFAAGYEYVVTVGLVGSLTKCSPFFHGLCLILASRSWTQTDRAMGPHGHAC